MTLHEHVDALDRMVTQGGSQPEIRSQIAFIGREITALEADFVRLDDAHTKLQDEHATLQKKHSELQAAKLEKQKHFKHPLGLLFERTAETDWQWRHICPRCGNIALVNPEGVQPVAYCAANCGWNLGLPAGTKNAGLLNACPA